MDTTSTELFTNAVRAQQWAAAAYEDAMHLRAKPGYRLHAAAAQRTARAHADVAQSNLRALQARLARLRRMAAGQCTYPHCKCIVGTSTTQPVPACPLGLAQ